MYCQKCQTQNGESAQFCINCGANLRYTQQEFKTENDVSSTLLLVYILIAFFGAIVNFSITKFAGSYWEGSWRYVMGTIWLISHISLILPALAIKNKSLKIIGIIFAAIVIIYHAYGDIEFMLRSY